MKILFKYLRFLLLLSSLLGAAIYSYGQHPEAHPRAIPALHDTGTVAHGHSVSAGNAASDTANNPPGNDTAIKPMGRVTRNTAHPLQISDMAPKQSTIQPKVTGKVKNYD